MSNSDLDKYMNLRNKQIQNVQAGGQDSTLKNWNPFVKSYSPWVDMQMALLENGIGGSVPAPETLRKNTLNDLQSAQEQYLKNNP